MTILAVILLLTAGALRTRIGRLRLALLLLRSANAFGAAGGRIVAQVEREIGR